MGTLGTRLVAVLAACAGYQAALLLMPRGPAVALSDVVIVLAAATAAGAAALRARAETGRSRRTWILVTLSSGAYTAGNLLYGLGDLHSGGLTSQRGPADACVTVAGLLVPAILFSLPAAPKTRDSRLRMLLDGLLSTSVLFFLGWAAVMRPIYDRRAVNGFASSALGGIALELVSLALVILLLIGRPRAGQAGLTLIGVAFGLFSATSVAFMLLLTNHPSATEVGLEGGFLAPTLLLTLASRLPLPAGAERGWEPATGLRGSVPYLGVGLAVAVAAGLQIATGDIDPVLLWPLLLMAGLVLLRQFLTLRVNDRLVGQLRRQQEQLAHQASHDQLTGLANRYVLADRLAGALSRVQRAGGTVALLLVDLDAFKPINDTYGHAAGDAVLIGTAARLRESVRPSDTVARLGGDEFAVLLEDLAEVSEAFAAATRMLRLTGQPLAVPQGEVTVRASIGIAVATGTPVPAELLMHQADLAMYRAKANGDGQPHLYHELVQVGRRPADLSPAGPTPPAGGDHTHPATWRRENRTVPDE